MAISVILHLSAGVLLASFHFDKTSGIPLTPEDTAVEFELVTENQLIFSSDQSNSKNSLDGPNQNSTEAIPKLGEQIGLESSDSDILISENVQISKEAVMMASLSDLSKMRESFNFMLNQVSADSSGAFVPLGGEAPDTDYLSAGSDGYGYGGRYGVRVSSGSGGGNCPGGGGILK
jgi:hypothetical protein